MSRNLRLIVVAFWTLHLTLGLAGCSRSDAPNDAAPAQLAADAVGASAGAVSPTTANSTAANSTAASSTDTKGTGAAAPEPTSAQPRQLIYRANLRVASPEPQAALATLRAWVTEHGGYVVSQRAQALVVRVPSTSFDAALGAVAEGGELVQRQIDVEDVSEELFDLRARLHNTEALRERLVQLLARAQSIDDLLGIERELARVSIELDSLKGRLRRLSELVTFSTIEVEWVELETDELGARARLPFPWLGTLGLAQLTSLEEQ